MLLRYRGREGMLAWAFHRISGVAIWLFVVFHVIDIYLVGGLGVAPGANIGAEAAVFEAVHGSAPKYAGLDKADPTALILSGVLLLRHIGEQAAAERVEAALRSVIAEGRAVTYDLGGTAGTSEMADAIVARLEAVTTPSS